MKTQAIIVMGGVGKRFKGSMPKQFVCLQGKPLGLYAVAAFEKSANIDSIIIVVPKEFISQMQELVNAESFKKVTSIAAGGQHRGDSVLSGLMVCDADTDIVCIHDGVRPLIKTEIIDKAIIFCRDVDAVVVGVKVKSTIKQVGTDQVIDATLDRDLLWEAQTPQVFKKDLIVQAYQKAEGNIFTDDAAVLEAAGGAVVMLEGNYSNIKITTPDDVFLADAFLSQLES